MVNRLRYLTEQQSCLRLTHMLLDQPHIDGMLQALKQHFEECKLAYQLSLVIDLPYDGLTLFQNQDNPLPTAETNDTSLENGPYRLIQATLQPLSLTADEFTSRYQALNQQYRFQAFSHYLALPILNHQQLLGLCAITRNDQTPFTQEEIAYLELICESLGIALEHLKARQALRIEQCQLCEERDNFHVLVNVTNAVLAQLDIEGLVGKIAQEIHRYFNINAVSIALPDRDSDYLNLYNLFFHQLEKPTYLHRRIEAAQSICQKVLESGEIRSCEIHQNTPFAKGETALFKLWPQSFHSVCLIPLKFAGQIRGVLKLAQTSPESLTPAKLKLLEQIAERTAIAVDNARAYREIKRLKDNLVHENRYLSEQIETLDHCQFDEIIGRSQAISHVLEQIEIVAKTNCSVLLLGETGTGKELFARAIHRLSPRNENRMIKMNCAAMPAGLLESDLFGHEKGAFTGASKDRMGRFELAHQSTLFLDEVGDMPLELQPKLLRVLQEQEFEKVGGNKLIHVDVRLIAATNRDLKQMVAEKAFRGDLFYRLNVFPIRLPPLRERLEDIPSLVKFFVFRACQQLGRSIDSIPAKVIDTLQQMEWPGNVRELQNVIERAVLLSQGNVLQLPPELNLPSFSVPSTIHAKPMSPKKPSLEEEYQRIINVLLETNGIVSGPRGAAQKLGLKRTTLLSRMKRLGIDKNEVLAR